MRNRSNRYRAWLIILQVWILLPYAAAAPTTDFDTHFSIPIRWCAMEGSPAVGIRSGDSDHTADEILRSRHSRATAFVWMPQSGISFRSALTSKTASEIGFPIIKDPHAPTPHKSGGPGLDGDILAPSLDPRKRKELNMAIRHCEQAWEQLEDQMETNFAGSCPFLGTWERVRRPSGASATYK